MKRLEKLFSTKKNNILSIYFTAGYPSLEDTVPVITELVARGVDMIEIGIPFSDPMADGKVIQDSSSAALRNGMSIRKLFSQLENIRALTDIPLVMMGYLNPIIAYGVDEFLTDCCRIGIDGLIVPDLPFQDYIKDFKDKADAYGMDMIMLITPETSGDRIKLIDDNTSGFIYMVSTASTTGSRSSFDSTTLDYFQKVRSLGLKNPLMIGFGISNADTLQTAFNYANGAIIGSQFIKELSTAANAAGAVANLKDKLGIKE